MKITNTHVYFWDGVFSNFFNCEIPYGDLRFHSSEQLFMWKKALHFNDFETANEIYYKGTHPAEAKKLGRKVTNFNNDEWDKVKQDIMEECLLCKFKNNRFLAKKLISHKDKIFVEASPYDKIWGVGLIEHDPKILDESKWEGKNLLGKSLNNIINNNYEELVNFSNCDAWDDLLDSQSEN